MASSRLTVYFEDPFWVGLYEREDGGRYEVSRIVFGAEPKDYEVYAFLLAQWSRLRFSPALETEQTQERRVNPKRMQRRIQRELERTAPAGIKAQQALKLQQEEGKLARRTRSRRQREEEKERQFALREEKRREKHKGH